MLTLRAIGKTGEPPVRTDSSELRQTSSDNLVCVALVPNIPYDLIPRGHKLRVLSHRDGIRYCRIPQYLKRGYTHDASLKGTKPTQRPVIQMSFQDRVNVCLFAFDIPDEFSGILMQLLLGDRRSFKYLIYAHTHDIRLVEQEDSPPPRRTASSFQQPTPRSQMDIRP